MFEILLGAFLVALGFCVIYYSIEVKAPDSKIAMYVLLGIAAIIGGGWIILSQIGIMLILIKLAGLITAVVGFFLVVKFPDVGEYQRGDFARTSIFIGIILLLFGSWLLFFY